MGFKRINIKKKRLKVNYSWIEDVVVIFEFQLSGMKHFLLLC